MQVVELGMQQILWRQDKQVYFRKNKSSACQLLALCNTTGRKRAGPGEHAEEVWCNPMVRVFIKFWTVFAL